MKDDLPSHLRVVFMTGNSPYLLKDGFLVCVVPRVGGIIAL